MNSRLQLAAGWAISALLLATLIVAAAALGTSILGVPTYYGNGIDPTLGAQVARDFLADQEAEASALSSGDQGPLGGHFTDSALTDVIAQMSNQAASGTPTTYSFQPASLTVLRAPDPNDSAFTIEVQEDGTETVTTAPANSAPTQQSISFHGDYWLRIPSGGHYAIADMNFQALPSSPLPAIAVVAAALLAVGLAAWFVLRQRSYRLALQPVVAPRRIAATVIDEAPADDEAEPAVPPAMVVSTFGGLQVREGGRDLAQELISRPVTGFVWLRLLVAAILDPNVRLSRDDLSRQSTPPGLTRANRLKRLRNVINPGLREMPEALRERIVVEPEALSFHLDGCGVDAIELLRVSAECSRRSQLSRGLVTRVRRVVDECHGDFLSEFETLENIATDRHPTCNAMMVELRQLLVDKRTDLFLALADAYLRDDQPVLAVEVLEPALRDRPERGDLRQRLATAYTRAGRGAEAAALEVKPA